MESSRHRILQLLQKHGRASVDRLAQDVGLASATVRRHLDILQRDRLITFDQIKKKTGRPEYSFYLTDEGQETLPKGYDRLLGSILQELAALSQAETDSQGGEELVRTLLHRAAVQTVRSHQDGDGSYEESTSKDALDKRVSHLQKVLEQEGFSPEIERVNGSLQICLHNCPFRRVALENPAICSYDSALISALLGTEVVQVRCIRDGDFSCCYEIAADGGKA